MIIVGTASTIDSWPGGAENGGMDGVIPAADRTAGAPAVPRQEPWLGTFGPPVRPPEAPREPGAWRRDVLRVLREPFSRRAIRERRYAALSLLLAIPGFALVLAGIVVGLGLSLSFAGMLTACLHGARKLGAVNRGLAARLLGERVAPPPRPRRRGGVAGWIRAGLTDPANWRACAYWLFKLPVAVASAVVASWILVYGLSYLTFPLWWAVLHRLGVVVTVPPWLAWWKQDPVTVAASVRTLPGAFALVPAGAAVLLANVAKHSGARHATLEAVHAPGLLRLRVSDDGAGGARIEPGGGLAGLAGQLRTVDGTMRMSSPPGGPTVITVELPSHA
jgi:Putative sensor